MSKDMQKSIGNTVEDKNFKKLKKSLEVLKKWIEHTVMLSAELKIICPQHEIFSEKLNYFDEGSKKWVDTRVKAMLPLCKYDQVKYFKCGKEVHTVNIEQEK